MKNRIVSVLIIMLLIILLVYIAFNIVIPQTTIYRTAVSFLQNNETVIIQTGEFIEYSHITKAQIMFGPEGSGRAILTLIYEAENGRFKAKILLYKIDGSWQVTDYLISKR